MLNYSVAELRVILNFWYTHYKVDKVSLLRCRQNQEKQSQLILNLTLPQQGDKDHHSYSFEHHKISRVLIGPGFIYAST